MAKRRLHLLIIDPQNDFCDLPPGALQPGPSQSPALPVPGAHADLLRLSELIDQSQDGLTDITVTLDTHRRLDIAHPGFWVQGDGSAVAPFTQITVRDVRSGAFAPRLPGALERVLAYLEALEAAGCYTHMVWPVHCEVGTWGHGVHGELRAALARWEERTLQNVAWVAKGLNPWTEHFSAVQAEVPDPQDPSTQLNRALLDFLGRADRVFLAGEAGSHCVRSTTEHLAEFLEPQRLSRLVLLEDCMSPVTGFESQQAGFLATMRTRGLSIARSPEVLPDLLTNARR